MGGRELALRQQKTKTAYARCACLQARGVPGPMLPSVRNLFPPSFMLNLAGNFKYVFIVSFSSGMELEFKKFDAIKMKISMK